MNVDKLMTSARWANKIALKLQGYFDPFLLTQTNRNKNGVPSAELLKVIKQYQLNKDDITCIFGLVSWRAESRDERYTDKERHAAEIEMLYTLIQSKIKRPADPFNFPIRRISVELKNGDEFVIADQINLFNLVNHGWPFFKAFLEKEFHDYIKPNYVPRSKRKRKGADAGKAKACKQLAIEIVRYLDKTTNLETKEKGNIVISMFGIAGYKLPYSSGKNAYDSLKRATRNT